VEPRTFQSAVTTKRRVLWKQYEFAVGLYLKGSVPEPFWREDIFI